MPNELFGRRARVIVGSKLLVAGNVNDGLRVAFNIEKTLKPEPNSASVLVWNLAETSRLVLEQLKAVPVQIEAGYQQTSKLFLGFLSEVSSAIEGPDIITTISSGDGEKAYNKSRINASFPRNTPIGSALNQLIAQLQILPGNALAQAYKFTGGNAVFPNGLVLSGNAAWELTNLLRSMGKEWSIQDGQAQVLDRGVTLLGTAVLLSKDTGMINAPSVDSDGVLKAQMLLAPDVTPGRLLVVQSRHASGNYRIEKCTYIGDTHAADWSIDIEAKRL